MPERVRDLPIFLDEITQLLRLVDQCSAVLFRYRFRQNLSMSVYEAVSRLEGLRRNTMQFYSPAEYPDMVAAGLAGPQLEMKLESFEEAKKAFDEDGNIESLEESLEAGGRILGSIAGAIPGFGSFAQELIDFILAELKKRLWRRKRRG